MDFATRLDEINLTTTYSTNNVNNQIKFDMWSLQTARSIHIYYTPLLIFFGIIGNFVSMYVFYVSKLRLQSTSKYLTALAISDTIFLLQLLLPWLADMAITGIFHRGGFCQLMVYMSYVACCMSAWLVVAFTVERFVAVLYPLKRKSMCTVTRARIIIAVIAMCALLANAPVLQFSTTIDGICDIDRDYLTHAAHFNISDTVISFTIPLAVIILLNTSIIVGVCKLERERQQLVKAERPTAPLRARPTKINGCPRSQYKVTRMLLIVSSVFVVFNLPAYAMRILAYAFNMNAEEFGSGRWFALQQLSTMLFHTNFGINFLLYCLSGQNFRKALNNAMPWVRRRARRGIAVRHATAQQERAGSVSSTSAFYVSNGMESNNVLARKKTRRKEPHFITKWIFDNSKRHANVTMPSTSVALNTEALEMRVFNSNPRVQSRTRSEICTTQF